MTRTEIALKLFGEKFHCSQAVLAAFAPELGLTEEQALRLGACFGTGMRKGEVCGACSGALMVLGMKYGQFNAADLDSRMRTNTVTDRFLARFAEDNGSYICNDLLGCDVRTPEGVQHALDNRLFVDFCPKMVASAVKLLEEIIAEQDGKPSAQ